MLPLWRRSSEHHAHARDGFKLFLERVRLTVWRCAACLDHPTAISVEARRRNKQTIMRIVADQRRQTFTLAAAIEVGEQVWIFPGIGKFWIAPDFNNADLETAALIVSLDKIRHRVDDIVRAIGAAHV